MRKIELETYLTVMEQELKPCDCIWNRSKNLILTSILNEGIEEE